MSSTPIPTSSITLDTKYGKSIRASPQTNGTTALCFLPSPGHGLQLLLLYVSRAIGLCATYPLPVEIFEQKYMSLCPSA
jgi:hypothetical protein